MNELYNRAKEIDERTSQKKVNQIKLDAEIREWNRQANKLRVWMNRTSDNPPTELDKKKLELAMFFFENQK